MKRIIVLLSIFLLINMGQGCRTEHFFITDIRFNLAEIEENKFNDKQQIVYTCTSTVKDKLVFVISYYTEFIAHNFSNMGNSCYALTLPSKIDNPLLEETFSLKFDKPFEYNGENIAGSTNILEICKTMRTLLIIVFALQFSNVGAQLKKFSSINDKPTNDLVQFLEQSNFGKVTLYYNKKMKKEGNWSYYPELKISNDLIAVCVSTLPETKDKYTFIIIVDTNSKNVKDTIGPFYDSFVYAAKFKLKNNDVNFAKIRIINPPEPFDPKFTIFEYKRKGQRLFETKRYDKN